MSFTAFFFGLNCTRQWRRIEKSSFFCGIYCDQKLIHGDDTKLHSIWLYILLSCRLDIRQCSFKILIHHMILQGREYEARTSCICRGRQQSIILRDSVALQNIVTACSFKSEPLCWQASRFKDASQLCYQNLQRILIA